MQTIELFAELFFNARVRVLPRLIRTPGTDQMLRRGQLGKVEGISIGEDGRAALALETSAGTVHIEFDGEAAVEALKAMIALPVNFPAHLRRGNIERQRVGAFDRDASDLSALGAASRKE